jgi:hypothetical protein
MLSFLLLAAVPAKAGTVHFADAVAPTQGRMGTALDVRLRVAPQSGNASTAAQQTSQRGAPASSPQQTGTNTSSLPTGTAAPADTTLTQSGGQVEIVEFGDVTGTVCDCGEIPAAVVPGGGFPLWPLLGLAGIPLAFIPGGNDRTPPGFNPPPVPTPQPPTPPSTPVPEPATLLLFGTSLLALGAGARRRLARRREGEGVAVAEEVI